MHGLTEVQATNPAAERQNGSPQAMYGTGPVTHPIPRPLNVDMPKFLSQEAVKYKRFVDFVKIKE